MCWRATRMGCPTGCSSSLRGGLDGQRPSRVPLATLGGGAIEAKAAGAGARPIAGLLDRPLGTVREWLRRFGDRVEAVRGWFTTLLCAVAPDPVPPQPAGSMWADAVAAMRATAVAVAARFAVTGVTVWQVVGAACGGRLLAPGWPTGSINTSSPWATLA